MHEGLQSITTTHTVDETVTRLQTILATKGIKLFCLVDHSGEAASVGLTMPPTKLLIFGNPKGGTPVMLTAPSSALDLPLKILVAEDTDGKVWVSYNSLDFLQHRHDIPADLMANLKPVEVLATRAAHHVAD